MNGLILSKDAVRYRELACERNSNFEAHCLRTVDEFNALPSETRSQIDWLLAEPALAVPVLDALPRLRWLQSTWAGVEKLLAHPRRNYTLTNIRGVFAPLMTEYVLTHALAHERHTADFAQAQRDRVWFSEANGARVGTLRGKTFVILGVGTIGLGLAQTLKHLGARVLGVVREARPIEGLDAVASMAQLSELLPQADYVVNTLPHTRDTVNFINAAFLAQMKPSAVLINVGRGQAVVEADLAQALRHGVIAHAVLDVFQTEPLPPEHEFWDTPHLTLTAHTAAPSFPNDIFTVFWDNYQRYATGQTLHHVVDFTKGY